MDALNTHSSITLDNTSTRTAPRLSTAAIPETSSAHRIAAFQSTCRGRGGGMVPVEPAATVSAVLWFSSDSRSCGAPQCGQNGDSPACSGRSPPHRWQIWGISTSYAPAGPRAMRAVHWTACLTNLRPNLSAGPAPLEQASSRHGPAAGPRCADGEVTRPSDGTHYARPNHRR